MDRKMKKGQLLPDDHHVMRHVPWARQSRDADGNVDGILSQAFELRQDEPGLSVNWVEYHKDGAPDPEAACIKTFRRTLDIKRSAVFGIGNVREISKITDAGNHSIRTEYSPTDENSSHSSMKGKALEDLISREKLATSVFVRLIKNADVQP